MIRFLLHLFFFISLIACQSTKARTNSDFLWEVVSQKCIPNQKEYYKPSPCAEVIFQNGTDLGYAIFKDRNGPLQYLLIPTTKITGIESNEILKKNSPNYFYEAWKARNFMVEKFNSTISDDEISLAINSSYGRSQNQLHIHISCIRSDIKDLISQKINMINNTWSIFPGGILGHHYFARRITFNQLQELNPFQILATELPEAKNKMNEFGLAVLAVKNKLNSVDFILLADQVNKITMDRASVEEIQDHSCAQLFIPKM